MPKLKAIIWDVDGTMADTERYGHLPACNEAFEKMGLKIRWEWDEYKELLKVPGSENRMRMALASHGALSQGEIEMVLPELFRVKKACYLRRIKGVPLRPGVEAIVREAVKRGIRLAIVSYSDEGQIRELLEHLLPDLHGHFHPVLGKQSGKRTSEKSELYERCTSLLGIPKDQVLVIEDSEKGFKSAKSAGLRCAITYNDYTKGQDFSGAELFIKTLEFLNIDLLERLCFEP